MPPPRASRRFGAKDMEAKAYRGRNLEICNLNDTLHGLGGLLIEPAPPGAERARFVHGRSSKRVSGPRSYRIRAWFAQFPAGRRRNGQY